MMASGSSVRGIIRCDDDKVGEPRGDLAHDGPLAPVPVSPAAKEYHQPPGGHSAQGAEDILHRVGGHGVVDVDAVVLTARHPLQPSSGAPASSQRRGAALQRQPQRHAGAQRREGIVDGKPPGYVQTHRASPLPAHRLKFHPSALQPDVLRPEVSLPLHGEAP